MFIIKMRDQLVLRQFPVWGSPYTELLIFHDNISIDNVLHHFVSFLDVQCYVFYDDSHIFQSVQLSCKLEVFDVSRHNIGIFKYSFIE